MTKRTDRPDTIEIAKDFLAVPFFAALASWGLILVMATSGADPDWIEYNVGAAGLVAIPATLVLIGGVVVILADCIVNALRRTK